jgi:hypothetical protein
MGGKGIAKTETVLEEVKKMAKGLTAITRKEELAFFLKCGFNLRKTVKDYYDSGVNGYHIVFGRE